MAHNSDSKRSPKRQRTGQLKPKISTNTEDTPEDMNDQGPSDIVKAIMMSSTRPNDINRVEYVRRKSGKYVCYEIWFIYVV